MENLPYRIKELVNLFTLNTYKDYALLRYFNKYIDYILNNKYFEINRSLPFAFSHAVDFYGL